VIRALVEQTFDASKKYVVLAGLSTDSKPTTGIVTGSKFIEVDTGTNYAFDEVSGTWSAATITMQDIKDEIDSWLENNIDPDSGYALDRTLSLENAAAPADMVGDLKSALQDSEETDQMILDKLYLHGYGTWVNNYYINENGNEVYSTGAHYLKGIDANPGDKIKIHVDAPDYLTITRVHAFLGDVWKEQICILSSSETNTSIDKVITVPSDVDNIRISTLKVNAIYVYNNLHTVIETIGNEIETITKGATKMPLLAFNAVFKDLDQNGEINTDNAKRVTTVNKLKNVILIVPPSGGMVSFYGFLEDGTALGYYNGNNNPLSKTGLSWSSSPISLTQFPEVAYIRVYCKKATESNYSGYQDLSQYYMIMLSEWYAQKKWYAIGDSITYGTYSYGNGSIAREPDISYAMQCSRLLDYDLTNYGVPNMGFTVNATDQQFTDASIVDVLTNHTFADAELITIALGTNDYGRNGALGTLADSSSVNSIYGRMKLIIETLTTKCPKARIIFMTPIPRETTGSLETQYDKLTPNNNGFTLNDVKDAIIALCTYYGIEYINLTDNFALNFANKNTYQKDNLHPTVQGHMVMAKAVSARLM
jgi:lysophospholipase L1-like esterase